MKAAANIYFFLFCKGKKTKISQKNSGKNHSPHPIALGIDTIFAVLFFTDIIDMRYSFVAFCVFSFLSLLGQQSLLTSSSYLEDLSTHPLKDKVLHQYEAEYRAFVQKNSDPVADNLVGLPLLYSNHAHSGIFALPVESGRKLLSKLSLRQDREVYVLFQKFNLKRGEYVFLKGSIDQQPVAVFSHEDNVPSGRFLAGPFLGDLYIEYHSATQLLNKTELPFELGQIFVSPNIATMELGFGGAFECQININCTEGQRYNNEKNGVMRIRMVSEEGIALCTGTLMNNTANNDIPYVLTAYHCLRPPSGMLNTLYDMWRFDFNYESSSCANPASEPTFVSLKGAELIAEWADTDMMLVRILEALPTNQNFYFNGWNVDSTHLPEKSVIIHHPAGDIKKISSDNDRITIHDATIPWDNNTVSSARSHFVNDFDDAVYQPGSSGCGLFNDRGLVIGQLHGGPLSDDMCTIGIGYSGRLFVSWNSGTTAKERLKDWLDPTNSGVTSLMGRAKTQANAPVQFIGRIITSKGIAIPNVEVRIRGDQTATILTGSDGRFVISNLSVNGNYVISFGKDSNHENGLSVSDIILMTNHLLDRTPLTNIFERLAADVNGDGRITSIDIVLVRNLLTRRITKFAQVPSWNFEPKTLEISGRNIGTGSLELQIIGYKMGDINGNANPRN